MTDRVEVTFESNDGMQLAGTLAVPGKTTGPVPGVVLFHGAEPATRSISSQWAMIRSRRTRWWDKSLSGP